MSSATASNRVLYRSYNRSGSSSENLPPRTLARVAREIRDLIKNPPEDVRLVLDGDTGVPSSLGEVVAEIRGPQGTPYENKYFQLKLVLSGDFPASPPRGFFLTKIYHPNVDMSTGAICVNTLKRDWSPDTTFSHVLSVIRCLLIIPFPESSLNDEAGKLFMESYEEYHKRARLMADIHGRPNPSGSTTEQKKDAEEVSTTSVLKPSDSTLLRPNPLRTSNGTSTGVENNGNTSATKNATTKSSKRMSKKKSLKRL